MSKGTKSSGTITAAAAFPAPNGIGPASPLGADVLLERAHRTNGIASMLVGIVRYLSRAAEAVATGDDETVTIKTRVGPVTATRADWGRAVLAWSADDPIGVMQAMANSTLELLTRKGRMRFSDETRAAVGDATIIRTIRLALESAPASHAPMGDGAFRFDDVGRVHYVAVGTDGKGKDRTYDGAGSVRFQQTARGPVMFVGSVQLLADGRTDVGLDIVVPSKLAAASTDERAIREANRSVGTAVSMLNRNGIPFAVVDALGSDPSDYPNRWKLKKGGESKDLLDYLK